LEYVCAKTEPQIDLQRGIFRTERRNGQRALPDSVETDGTDVPALKKFEGIGRLDARRSDEYRCGTDSRIYHELLCNPDTPRTRSKRKLLAICVVHLGA
jgi:hypothetical protein